MRRAATSAVLLAWQALTLAAPAAPLDFLKATNPASLDDAWREVPAPMRPAVDFQKVLLRLRAQDPAWRPDMAKFASAPGEEAVTIALRELARCWEARARMTEIDRSLRNYYRKAICFPDSLAAVERNLSDAARVDPWGQPWIYSSAAPVGFSAKFARQRYQLGPTRWPHLSTLDEALAAKPAPRSWKIALRNVGGARALEMRAGEAQGAVVQAGGTFGDAVIAYIGEGWALLADTERLFAITF